jgi:hypothetical protein
MDWLTPNVIGPKIGVLFEGWLLKMITLVKGMFPELLTLPLNVSNEPGSTSPVGQTLVTAIAGLLQMVQLALLVAQTVFGTGAVSVPHATIVSTNGPHRLTTGW